MRFNDTDNQYCHCDLSHHSTFILIYSVHFRQSKELKEHATDKQICQLKIFHTLALVLNGRQGF